MKRLELKYIGYQNKFYCFTDATDSIVRFSGVRSELILEFDLREATNSRTMFEVVFFTARDSGDESNIISDMKIISGI